MTREQYSTSSAGSTLRRQCAPVRLWARMTLNRGEKKWLVSHAPLPEKVTDRPNRRLWCPSTLRLSDGVVSCVALRRPNGARVGRVQHLRPGASPLLCHGRPVTDSMLSLISLKSHSTSAKMARANECACMRSPLQSFPPPPARPALPLSALAAAVARPLRSATRSPPRAAWLPNLSPKARCDSRCPRRRGPASLRSHPPLTNPPLSAPPNLSRCRSRSATRSVACHPPRAAWLAAHW